MSIRRPPIVKELRAGSINKVGPRSGVEGLDRGLEHGVRGGNAMIGWRGFLQSGAWKKPFHVFTWVLSGSILVLGVTTDLIVGEVDEFGREHCFTGIQRAVRKRRDQFFGVETPDFSLKTEKK